MDITDKADKADNTNYNNETKTNNQKRTIETKAKFFAVAFTNNIIKHNSSKHN